MNFSATEIGVVTQSLQQAVIGTLVRKVLSPEAGDRICLELRSPGQNHYLQIAVAPAFCGIGRVEHKPKSADTPTPFVMLLRKMCINCVVTQIEQRHEDRVVAITLARRDTRLMLMCELSGRHANLFLLDSNEIILGAYFPNRSTRRQLVCQQTYQLPLPPPQLPNSCNAPRVFTNTANADMALMKLATQDESTFNVERKRIEANRAVTMLIKKQTALVTNLQSDQQKAQQSEQLKRQAYVLQAHLHRISKGAVSFQGTDFDGSPICFSLNPKWSPVENMQAMFNKASRLGRAVDKIEERLLQAMIEDERLQELKNEIATAAPKQLDDYLLRLEKENAQVVQRAKKRSGVTERLPYRQYPICGAHTARVGKSAKDNDALTLHHANPGDLWLHVRGIPGSHVVVPMGRGEEPSSDVLVDAAHLAAHFSSARNAELVEITYTRRKYVQKPKGAAPGSVRLLKEKTILLKMQPARLQEILSALR